MKLEDFEDKYEKMFDEAEDLGNGLGEAIAAFLTAHHPIKNEILRDFKKQSLRLRAAVDHKDQRMISVANTILNTTYQFLTSEYVSQEDWVPFLGELKNQLGDSTYNMIMDSPKNSLPTNNP